MKLSNIFLAIIALILLIGCNTKKDNMEHTSSSYETKDIYKYVILISANAEWKVIKELFPEETYIKSPWGEYFIKSGSNNTAGNKTVYFHGGWGKIAAAGSAQYVIDKFSPEYIINLGTCGGFKDKIEKFETILVTKTIVYDIVEAMGDSKEAIDDYSTVIDLNWLDKDYPVPVIDTLLVSADKDLMINEIEFLNNEYGAIAGDWETGAIAYVCNRNNQKLLILRSVSDLVDTKEGEAYDNFELFEKNTAVVMNKLIEELPSWIKHIEK